MKKIIKEIRLELKQLRRFLGDRVNKALVWVMVVLIGLGLGLYKVNRGRVEESLREQMLHRGQVIVRAGAQSMEGFFNEVMAVLIMDARDPVVIGMGPGTQRVIEKQVMAWKGSSLVGIEVVNSEGRMVYSANNQEVESEVRISVAERDYFKWAKDESKPGESYHGKPVISKGGASEGQMIVPMVVPIFEGESFKGVLVGAVLLSDLTDQYVHSLKISEETRIYLLDEEGLILHAPIEKLVGVNYFELIENRPFEGWEGALTKLRGLLEIHDEGKLDVVLPNELTGVLTRYLMATAPIDCHNEHWVLGIATPDKDAMKFMSHLNGNIIAVLVFILTAVLAFSILVVLVSRLVGLEAYKEGYREGRRYGRKKKS